MLKLQENSIEDLILESQISDEDIAEAIQDWLDSHPDPNSRNLITPEIND